MTGANRRRRSANSIVVLNPRDAASVIVRCAASFVPPCMYATGAAVTACSSLSFTRSVCAPTSSSRQSVAFSLARSPSTRASFASATLPSRRDRLRARFAAWSMGNKPRLVCIACGAAFKRASGPKSARCKTCRAKALAAGESLEDDVEATLIGFKRDDVADASERADGMDVGGVAEGGVSKNASGGGGGKRRKKKAKKGHRRMPPGNCHFPSLTSI